MSDQLIPLTHAHDMLAGWLSDSLGKFEKQHARFGPQYKTDPEWKDTFLEWLVNHARLKQSR